MTELSHIRKSYRQKKVLTDLSLTLKEGECVGLLGANGCGKSTLLSILAGVQKPDDGQFLKDGVDLFGDHRLLAETVAYVPQGTPLIEELSARDNLRLFYGKAAMERELDGGKLEKLGIGEFLKVRVSRMSGGMKKRLSIACALAGKPSLLLLDEPSAALDIPGKETIASLLSDFKKSGGTVLLTTHEISEIALCDRWFLLSGGTLSPYDYDGDLRRLAGELSRAEV